MVWVAVFALVCMAAVAVALVGIAGYLLYTLARRLVHRAAVLFGLGRQRRRDSVEPAERVAHT